LKIILLSLIALSVILSPVYGQLLSDATGLVNRLDIQSAGHTFEVKTVSNFDIYDFDFNRGEKLLTLYISSHLKNNLGEVIIPTNLLSGNFTLVLNDQEYIAKISPTENITFITLNFTGSGDNHLKIFATEALSGITEKPQDEIIVNMPVGGSDSNGGGCLIATAAYGTELASQVQQLREIRNNQLLSTDSGTSFVSSFNQFYYSFSPGIADFERENAVFKEFVRLSITPMIASLSILNYAEINSEIDAIVIGSGLILLNLGVYVGIPASVIISLRQKF